jgi:hypothetical protein
LGIFGVLDSGKKVRLPVEAFNELGYPPFVIGEG